MTFPRFSFLKPKPAFPNEALPNMQVKDLARLPLNDPFARAVLQIAYQGWQAAYARALTPGLSPEERAHWTGRTAALHEFIAGLEQAHAAARESAKG